MFSRLGPLIASTLFSDVAPALRRARRNTVLYGLCAVFALTGYGALVIALGIWIGEAYGALEAAFTIAVAMIALAVLVLLVVMIANRIDRRRHAARDRSRTMTATLALSLLPVVVRSRPLMATAVAGGLAFVILSMLSGGDDDAGPQGE
ncbi:hypothetical protein C8N35_101987 [Breoghania corrubedonensis]|uniref:Uncharacterized protein n=1 Tax=Breoghania corrubedonensis TaxID=665038 RepID=A0A2T5VGS8_9HYPH|nr:hypothetical protein [Breoghania corrubedonensis]PTW62938.1 hypothetical protein C8N35_101987 [Breoghania corrubedonensis]